ncbi:MAG: phosphoribosylformylglycinamidine synthase subunit PurS [Alicyclobacillaceae bacterium]|uniref:phosphoribosylformylglycinamidine synthase subunit PurS n=1 Tax=Alicyclobacillus sp. SP_1 TaxID=2942475 RepID=UPI002157E13B|nr:phosphoribosylformylglycinamidine synthase subunit PurS [Alicyclobacillus sp. SP_1]MCY0888001.1 phosphoribosylformylglycinamidine synthase subunit PurS [Alicyclobacillaceae bacterium]MCY0896528.1 phosphoribosylformylglycinamidine synthase subunit PurS [Alicyclobacillaceae bacterium]
MKEYRAEVHVWLKPSVFDPQGNAVEKAVAGLGHTGIRGMRVGKSMEFTVEADSKEAASKMVETVCDRVLCNPVMETYRYVLTARDGE